MSFQIARWSRCSKFRVSNPSPLATLATRSLALACKVRAHYIVVQFLAQKGRNFYVKFNSNFIQNHLSSLQFSLSLSLYLVPISLSFSHDISMEDFTAPSFSLGLDLDFDSEPQTAPIEASPSQEAPETSNNASFETFQDDGDFQLPALDPGLQSEDPPPRLKRLKRGPAPQLSRVFDKQPAPPYLGFDDDIEEFSSQEDPREVVKTVKHSARQNRSACSSSKFPLHGHRALMTQSNRKAKVQISAPVSNASTSANLDASSSKLMFPNLTISPLRRFQLLDSDSEDPSSSVDACEDAIKTKTSPIERQYKPTQVATWNQQKGVETSKVTVQDEDLWKGFCPQKNISISTPGLDEYCDEHFQSLKNNNSWQRMESDICLSSKSHMKSNSSKVNVFQRMEGDVCANSSRTDQKSSTSGKDEWIRNLEDYFPPARDYQKKFPPAHQYFYHGDPRIRRLVRNRLCNFFPLGALNHRERMQPDAAVIDYMSQFGHKEGHQLQENGKTSLGGSKKRGRQNSKLSKAEEISQASGSWVNPRSNANNPRDAGKRRVHANGCSSGHWFTGQDGRKVYVTRNGQELTGATAYRHYRKESGKGFKKARKKVTAKKSKR